MRLIVRLGSALLFLLVAALCGQALAQTESTTSTVDGRTQQTLKLPGTIDDIIVGGSGKYLIAYLKGVQKLAVIDVKQAKVIKYLPLTTDVLFAAGAEKLFIVLIDQSVIQRWNLATLEREVSSPLPDGLSAAHVLMGHGSLGPVLISPQGESYNSSITLLDAKTMKEIPDIKENIRKSGRGFEAHQQCVLRASGNGQVFTSWRTGTSPSGFYTLVLNNGKPETFYEHESLGLLTPNADGTRIYTSSGGVYNNKAKSVSGAKNYQQTLIPSVTGDYYLQFTPPDTFRSESKKSTDVSIHLAGDSRPITKINNLTFPSSGGRGSKLYYDKRIFYFPDSSSLVTLDQADDSLQFIKVDLDQELEKSGIDYLFINSRPPATVDAGKNLDYQINVKSKKGGVKMSLASGPDGMKLSPTGKLTWAVPASGASDVDVILSVSDSSGQEVFQTFRLAVNGGSAASSVAAVQPPVVPPPPVDPAAPRPLSPMPPSTTKLPPRGPRNPNGGLLEGPGTPTPAATPPAASGPSSATAGMGKLPALTPAKITGDSMTLKLPAPADRMELGGGGRYFILHLKSLRKLAVVDLVEAKIAGYVPADDDSVYFAAGADKLIVVLGDKNILMRWNLETLQREVTVPLENRPAGVVMGHASAGPVLVLNSGERFGNGGGMQFLDLGKLSPLTIKTAQRGGMAGFGGNAMMARAAADGRTFYLPGSFGGSIYTFDGIALQTNQNNGGGDRMNGMGLLSPDGEVIYSGALRYNKQMKPLGKVDQSRPGILVPAAHGRFYLSIQFDISSRANANNNKIAIHIEGDSRPLVLLDGFKLFTEGQSDIYGHQSIPVDKRIAFVPDAKLIAYISTTFDSLELRKFDLDQALESSGIDYLFVTSRPPTTVKAKEALKYQITVKSKKGGNKYRLESGPEGMTISPQGLITWQVPAAEVTNTNHTVIVAISDAAEQEVFHTFQVTLPGEGPKPGDVAANPPTPKPPTQPIGPPPMPVPISPATIPEVRTPPVDPALPPTGKPAAPSSSPYAALIGQTRTFTDAKSGRSIEAIFQGVENQKVRAVNKDGIELAIPIERLSREDLLWLLGITPTASK